MICIYQRIVEYVRAMSYYLIQSTHLVDDVINELKFVWTTPTLEAYTCLA